MATLTTTPTLSSSITINGNTQVNRTIDWTVPEIPSGATVSSCVLTGTPNINMTSNTAIVTVNGTTVTNGTSFSITLSNNSINSVSVTARGSNKRATGTVSFSNLLYTITYEDTGSENPEGDTSIGSDVISHIYYNNVKVIVAMARSKGIRTIKKNEQVVFDNPHHLKDPTIPLSIVNNSSAMVIYDVSYPSEIIDAVFNDGYEYEVYDVSTREGYIQRCYVNVNNMATSFSVEGNNQVIEVAKLGRGVQLQENAFVNCPNLVAIDLGPYQYYFEGQTYFDNPTNVKKLYGHEVDANEDGIQILISIVENLPTGNDSVFYVATEHMYDFSATYGPIFSEIAPGWTYDTEL